MARSYPFTAALLEPTVGRNISVFHGEKLFIAVSDLPPGTLASFTVSQTAGGDPLLQVDGSTVLVVGPILVPGVLQEGVTYRYNLWRIAIEDGDRDLLAYGDLVVAPSILAAISGEPAPTLSLDSDLVTFDSDTLTMDAL